MYADKHASLLVEFLTEELPPINMEHNIGISFGNNLSSLLKNFLPAHATVTPFVSPRRFGCLIHEISNTAADTQNTRRGPSINNGLNNQEPTAALLGFAKSCNVNWQELEQNNDGYFYATAQIKGRKLEDTLEEAIITSLKKLPIAKNMRWGNNDYSFVRPIHNLLILHGDQIIAKDITVMGCKPNNYTFGHRIMSRGKIIINRADNYLQDMHQQGIVIANFKQRLAEITTGLNSYAKKLNLKINDMPGLFAEVTALVEYPVVLHGEFNPEFLQIPQECLILTMAKNQKYFALLDDNKNLSNKFLFVANIKSTNPEVIIQGNEKVLSARLQDAKFFFEVDKKNSLGAFVEKLGNVIYHNKLGSQLERIVRLQNIAREIAELLKVNPDIARSTAYVLKADLASEMVAEFPELQGIMGKYYAKFHGETDDVANAIEKHYYPRFSGDELPNDNLATTMALTDKLETLIGIWGIGLQPTGDKDPFALRRAALGIARILLRDNLDILQLLNIAYSSFSDTYNLNPDTVNEVYKFILGRLENYLAVDYSINCLTSVLGTQPLHFIQIPSILDKLNNFAGNPQNYALLQANKRIENILSKNGYLEVLKQDESVRFKTLNEKTQSTSPKNIGIYKDIFAEIDKNLLYEDAEKILYEQWQNANKQAKNYIREQNWEDYFNLLSSFNQPITNFFDQVMVMSNDLKLKNNRINLLTQIYTLTNKLCKLSELD